MRNIGLVVAYDGTDFHGWQRQPGVSTVQEILEKYIAKVVKEPVKLYGSGRTDAGVHAAGQVANFRTTCVIPCNNLMIALNDALPPSIRIRRVQEVHSVFHARYDAHSKTYRYRILQSPICPPFLWRFVHHYPYALNFQQMAKTARLFEGEHDFTSFAGTDHGISGRHDEKQEASNIRLISTSRLVRHKRLSLLIYEISGTGFLHHMVRNIVGTLIEVGKGKLSSDDLIPILDARDRGRAGPTAPARGLCLVKVEYRREEFL
ncbi:MAG: tRNA pseudouridine(38-40) synthase TruA [Acidobacteria bacterium]|nr:tRNA pseudouridine(38-40) synthase TruA [Acidobacteriota bacterium]